MSGCHRAPTRLDRPGRGVPRAVVSVSLLLSLQLVSLLSCSGALAAATVRCARGKGGGLDGSLPLLLLLVVCLEGGGGRVAHARPPAVYTSPPSIIHAHNEPARREGNGATY